MRIDKKLQPGYVWMPNGFGAKYGSDPNGPLVPHQGANANELTDVADRDPFTGCPHHKAVAVKVTRVESQTAAA